MALSYFFLRLLQQEERNERWKISERRRISREHFNIHSVTEQEFIENYKLSRELFETLCKEITPLLPPKKRRNALDPAMKILSALNFFAWGRYQGVVGQNCNMPIAQQTVSRCIREVTDALNHPSILQKYLKFPQDEKEKDVIIKKFSDKFSMPNVIGCIDCTHVAIVKPRKLVESFRNENALPLSLCHSLNIQIICDADCNVLNVDATYGGATQDCEILINHNISNKMKDLGETAYLLGDADYPLRDYLMTPITEAIPDSPEGRYNVIHKEAHSTITRTISALKARWRCLLTSKELHYVPETAGKIVIACCVLHNMCNMAGMEAPMLSKEDLREESKRENMLKPELQDFTEDVEARKRLVQLLEENRLN